MRYSFFYCMVCFFLSFAVQGQDNTVIDLTMPNMKEHLAGKIAYYKDTTGKMSIEEAITHFDKKTPTLPTNQANFHQSTSAFWFKFDIKHTQFDKTTWVAEIPYPSLDYVDFYYQDKAGKWHIEHSGDRILFKEKSIETKINAFRLVFHSADVHTFYIRVKTNGILQIPFNFQEIIAFFTDTAYEEAFLGVFYGMMIAFALYNLFIFLVLYDKAYIYYSVYMLVVTFFTASTIGHTFQYVFFNAPTLIEPSLILSGGATIFSLCVFIQNFLNTQKELAWGHWWLQIVKILAVIDALIFLTLGYTFAVRGLLILMPLTVSVVISVSIYAMYKNIPASHFLTYAFVSMVTGVIVYALMQMSVLPYNLFTVHAARFGLGFQGLLFSLALADRYRILRRRLYKQEREANEVLERKVQERTEELHRLHQEVVTQNEELHQTQEEIMAQRDAIEVKNQELATQNEQIQNSIRAAKAIQKAIVPHQQKRDDLLKDYFVIYRPRDVVSGDIYWLHKIEDSVFMAVIDCTGHGVPGAFMTMITHNLLDKIVRVWDIHSPSEVLNRLHEEITTVLRQKETDNNYGMDMSFTTTMPQQDGTYHIVFAGAKQNAYYVQEGEHEVKVLQGVRKSIGGLQREDIEFTNISLNLTNGSQLYLSTDGYIDQNDLKRKRIGEKAFIQLLQDIHQNDMYTQKQLMIKYLYNYMRDTVQRDDILVLGIKLDNREN